LIVLVSLVNSPQDRGKVSRISPTDMDHEHSLKQLKEALQAHHQALEQLESALLEFERSISWEVSLRPQEEQQRAGVQLPSIPQLCQELGMGKSWVYRRLRSGEIPSVRLGRTIKVRRDELEQYLQSHHYPARDQALQEEESPLGGLERRYCTSSGRSELLLASHFGAHLDLSDSLYPLDFVHSGRIAKRFG
jgi:excisionase family DNA binding protein